jgi:hypothetical protein
MIDESYDRAFREGRADLNATVIRLITALRSTFRKPPQGETSCAPDPSASPLSHSLGSR